MMKRHSTQALRRFTEHFFEPPKVSPKPTQSLLLLGCVRLVLITTVTTYPSRVSQPPSVRD